MEEVPENGKESSHCAHANGKNEEDHLERSSIDDPVGPPGN
jgi:hypothetical protein